MFRFSAPALFAATLLFSSAALALPWLPRLPVKPPAQENLLPALPPEIYGSCAEMIQQAINENGHACSTIANENDDGVLDDNTQAVCAGGGCEEVIQCVTVLPPSHPDFWNANRASYLTTKACPAGV